MADLHQADSVLMSSQSLIKSVDPVTRKSKNRIHVPIDEAFHQDIRDGGGHGFFLSYRLRQ
jgi:hypothetical protein